MWDKSEVLWRTCWRIHYELGEHSENILGTQGKMKKNPSHPKLKWKKARHLECLLGPSHWLQTFLFPKEFVTIFGLG
jgi:hypothetical protein